MFPSPVGDGGGGDGDGGGGAPTALFANADERHRSSVLLRAQVLIGAFLGRPVLDFEYTPLESLRLTAELCECEERHYEDHHDDPLSDERGDFVIGSLIARFTTDDECMNKVSDWLCHHNQHPLEEITAVIRALVSISAGHATSILRILGEEDVLETLIQFVEDVIHTELRTFATGLLNTAAWNDTLADEIVQSHVPLTIFRRLHSMLEAETPLTKESLEYRERRYCTWLLSHLAVYNNVLVMILQEDAHMDTLMRTIDGHDAFCLADGLNLIAELAGHKRFGIAFVKMDGIQRIVDLPFTPHLNGSRALCMYRLSGSLGTMEEICKLPQQVLERMNRLGLWLLACPQESAQEYSTLFFAQALQYRPILEVFDDSEGLITLIECLQRALHDRRLMNRTIAHHASLALRQYFRTHLVLFVDALRRQHARNTARGMGEKAKRRAEAIRRYVGIPIDSVSMSMHLAFLEKERMKQVAVPWYTKQFRWMPAHRFLQHGGVGVALSAIDQSDVAEMTQHLLDVLHVVTIFPFSHLDIVHGQTEDGHSGIAVILEIGNEVQRSEPDVLEACLRVLVNLISLPVPATVPGIARGRSDVSEYPLLGDQNDDLRVVRETMRSNNCIWFLMNMIRHRHFPSHADSIRALACRSLLGLAQDPTVLQILRELHVGPLLSDLLQKPVLPGKTVEHRLFRKCALELIAKEMGPSLQRETDATVNKIEKTAIALTTNITYDQKGLLQIIYSHLLSQGMPSSASALAREAGFVPEQLSSAPTLDTMVKEFLRQQHRECPYPISTLPPFSLSSRHVCPVPIPSMTTNVVHRLHQRSILPNGGFVRRQRDRNFLYSKLRPFKVIREANVQPVSSLFHYSGSYVYLGCPNGNIQTYETGEWNSLRSWTFEHTSSEITWMAQHPLSDGHDLFLACSPFSCCLWRIPHEFPWQSSLGHDIIEAKHYFEECTNAQFNCTGSLVVASSSPDAFIFDVETGRRLRTLITTPGTTRRSYTDTVASFSQCGTLVLFDGVLWDHRIPVKVKTFDQFGPLGEGKFHPRGFEVIINSEVWDLRTFKLLRSVSALDKTVLTFNLCGDVLFAAPHSPDADTLSNSFCTLDGTTYDEISYVHTENTMVGHLSIAPNDLYLIAHEEGPDEANRLARVYEIGREKSSDDSDSDGDEDEEKGDEERSSASETFSAVLHDLGMDDSDDMYDDSEAEDDDENGEEND